MGSTLAVEPTKKIFTEAGILKSEGDLKTWQIGKLEKRAEPFQREAAILNYIGLREARMLILSIILKTPQTIHM